VYVGVKSLYFYFLLEVILFFPDIFEFLSPPPVSRFPMQCFSNRAMGAVKNFKHSDFHSKGAFRQPQYGVVFADSA